VKISYHIYKDYSNLVTEGDSDEQIFFNKKHAKQLARLRFSLLCFAHDRKRGKLYVGATNTGGDILLEFDLRKKKFRSCGYAKSGFHHQQDMKLHKGLWLDEKEDVIYLASGKLSNVHKIIDGPGSKMLRYHLASGKFELLAAPMPGDYCQATLYDPRRKKMYLYTMPGACFAVFDIKKKKIVRRSPVESVPHTGCIDDAGGVWGTWGFGRQAFFRYSPDDDSYEFPEGLVLPDARKAASVMYPGAGPIDAFINGGDGWLYVSSALGELYRLDPREKKLEYLGKPFPGKRLPGLCLADDGLIYLAGGSDRATELARYDRGTGQFERLGPIAAPDGKSCYRCHELIMVNGTAWIGETDNKDRSGYLWECEL